MMDLARRLKASGRVFIIGNGGSAANAMHMANDLVSCGVAAEALLDVATLTAIANDYGYEHVFSRQLSVKARSEDFLIALSGSGRSRNILEAVKVASEIGMGYELVTDYLRTSDMQQSEEAQVALAHDLMRALR